MSLNVEAMRELIEDLRNQPGNYRKATGRLRDDNNGYCCLGRACEVAVRHEIIPPATKGVSVTDTGTWYYGARREAAVLPKEVADWFGMTDCPTFNGDAFTSMNDGGMSHPNIADKFEAMLEADQAFILPTAHSHKDA